MLKQRVTVGVIGAIFCIAILCMDVRIISLVLALVAVIGLSEIYNATGILREQNKLCVFSYAYTIITFIVIGFSENPAFALGVMLFLYGFGLLSYLVFCHDKCDFSSIAGIFFQTLYVAFLFAHIILVRKLSYGNYIMWFIFVTAWLSDTLAYFVGIKFGRNKLIPAISPKKTIEGSIGGLAGSVIFNIIFALVCSLGFDLSVNYFAVFFMAIIAGAMSQLGDLTASAIKREYGIKDYSNLLPGHGGVMDRCDSILPTAMYGFLVMYIFNLVA